MNVYLLILGMLAVTYIPRVIPAFVVDKLRFEGRFGRFINLIPYTAMTALIVPDVINVSAAHWYVGVIGGATALVLACIKRVPTAVVVFGAVAAVMLTYICIG